MVALFFFFSFLLLRPMRCKEIVDINLLICKQQYTHKKKCYEVFILMLLMFNFIHYMQSSLTRHYIYVSGLILCAFF